MFRKIWQKIMPPRTPLQTGGMPLAFASASMPKVQHVTMGRNDKTARIVEVQSLPVGYYLDLMPRLENIPSLIIQGFKNGGKYELGQFVYTAMDVAKDEFMLIIEKASGLDRDFIVNEVSLKQLVCFVKALHEVNEFEYIAGEIRAAILKGINTAKAEIQEA